MNIFCFVVFWVLHRFSGRRYKIFCAISQNLRYKYLSTLKLSKLAGREKRLRSSNKITTHVTGCTPLTVIDYYEILNTGRILYLFLKQNRKLKIWQSLFLGMISIDTFPVIIFTVCRRWRTLNLYYDLTWCKIYKLENFGAGSFVKWNISP